MKKWQTTLHGSMMIVMLGNSLPAYAQQGVTIKNGGDVVEGSLGDTACATSGAASCTIAAIVRGVLAGVQNAIPPGTAAIGTTSVIPATLASWGLGSIAAIPPVNAPYWAGLSSSTEPSKATTGNLTGGWFDLAGKAVVSPYAARELMVRGAASASGTAAVTLIAPQGSGVKTYVTDIQCGRTDAGTTAITVTFSDGASTLLVIPNNGGGGGNNISPKVPLVTGANATFTFAPSASISTVFCSAQAFAGY